MTDLTELPESVAEQAAQMERLNQRQKEYYEADGGDLTHAGNVVTRVWTSFRGRVTQYRNAIGVKQDMRALHYRWFGDLTGCDVMELGCASGNKVSRDLAAQAQSYLGVDLNSVGVGRLNEMLAKHQLPNGKAVTADFLSQDFSYGPFDVVYAQGVLHHFRYFDAFLKILHSRLKPGGRVVAWDPLQTALLPRMVRAAYRPFQSDADWEWPFTKETYRKFDQYFDVAEVQGMMGWAKWGIPLVPFSPNLAEKVGKPLHQRDMRVANQRSRALWRCMNVATLLVRKD